VEKEEYRRLYELEDQLWWFVGMRHITLTLMDRFLAGSEDLQILDAGCGTGGMLPHLARFGTRLGIDVSDEALRFARLREVEQFARASVSKLPFPDDTFDLVTSFDVVYHRGVPDDEAALAEMARVLRTKGSLIIRVPAYNWMRSSHDEAVHTERRYTRRELEVKLARAGLSLTYATYANTLLFPVAVAYRLLGNLRSNRHKDSDVGPVNPLLNSLFLAALKLEGTVLRYSRLPHGLSLIAIGKK
jgi:SAM-dependent methyltransferase